VKRDYIQDGREGRMYKEEKRRVDHELRTSSIAQLVGGTPERCSSDPALFDRTE